MEKHGVRIYPLDKDVILVKQTVKKDNSPSYVVDVMADGNHREAHVNIKDDAQIADAVRTALAGHLKRSI